MRLANSVNEFAERSDFRETLALMRRFSDVHLSDGARQRGSRKLWDRDFELLRADSRPTVRFLVNGDDDAACGCHLRTLLTHRIRNR